MDYKNVEEIDNGVMIKGVKNFELEHIFECGQCFRWHKNEEGNYVGVAFENVIEVEKQGKNVILYNTDIKQFEEIWSNYFDFKRDYSKIKKELSKDTILKNAVEFGHGIRLLKQEPFELLISFIISANNRIPMIKRTIQNISKRWGEEKHYKNQVYYAFPTLENLKCVTLDDIKECGAGFRSKYIIETINQLNNGEINLSYIADLDDDACHNELKKFSGVGPKVADCIMLFSMSKYSAFPVDIWVKRAMQYFYLAPDVSLPKIRQFARKKFGNISGFAQQYLFYYARENNIQITN